MGVGGAGWLERPEREDEEAPSKALDALELKPGMVVADIGAGSGYYSSRIAKRVGPTGPRLRHRYSAGHDRPARSADHSRRARPTSRPCWAGWTIRSCRRASIDLAIMVDVYHELQQPQIFLQRLKETFKPGGRLVLLEFRKEDPKVPILEVHKMSVAEVKQELEAEGFVLDKVIDVLPWQHIIVLQGEVTITLESRACSKAQRGKPPRSSSAPSS